MFLEIITNENSRLQLGFFGTLFASYDNVMGMPFFTPEEMEALRADMQQQPKERLAETVDLVTGDHSFRKNVPAIERRLELFAGPAQGLVTRALRRATDCKLQPADVIGPRTAYGVMRELVIVVELFSPGNGVLGFLGFEPDLAFLLIERTFGAASGDDETPFAAPNRAKLSDVERETLVPILKELTSDLAARLFEDSEVTMKANSTPGGLPPEVPSRVETTLVWRVLFDMGGQRTSAMTLVLLPSLVDLVVRRSDAETENIAPDWIPRHMKALPVEMAAMLGTATINVQELLALKVGDLLRLDRGADDAVPVLVEGAKKFLGRPVQRNGAFGVELVTGLGEVKEV